jgi:hypothetical protein
MKLLLWNQETGHILDENECVYAFGGDLDDALEFKSFESAREYLEGVKDIGEFVLEEFKPSTE